MKVINVTTNGFDKFQSAYKTITGHNIDWNDISENLRNSFFTGKPLSGQEFIELPRNLGAAYLIARKLPDNVILDKIKKQLVFYEDKYHISSKEFYCKYHNSESIFDGPQEQVLDFLTWQSYYEEYLELKNVIR
ncbi:hypothetical protein FJZ31_05815 [Candidatus Poribacteria bacterium]|nr:hypothetical protein [Candidatus Poribacteria bacterium]